MREPYNHMKQLTMIRHSEAEKTERRVHGGEGTSLTNRGRTDSIDLARHLRKHGLLVEGSIIFTGPRPQALETAQVLGDELGTSVVVLDDLRNISMGIFDDLTDYEARARDPDAISRLEAWRAGQMRVEDIHIPGAEDPRQFVSRIEMALIHMITTTETPIVIVTRSVGIALYNLLTPLFNWDFTGYRRIRLDPGSVTVFCRDSTGMIAALQTNETGYLAGERQFADD